MAKSKLSMKERNHIYQQAISEAVREKPLGQVWKLYELLIRVNDKLNKHQRLLNGRQLGIVLGRQKAFRMYKRRGNDFEGNEYIFLERNSYAYQGTDREQGGRYE